MRRLNEERAVKYQRIKLHGGPRDGELLEVPQGTTRVFCRTKPAVIGLSIAEVTAQLVVYELHRGPGVTIVEGEGAALNFHAVE